jgi:large conductance mechanosensitive channel
MGLASDRGATRIAAATLRGLERGRHVEAIQGLPHEGRPHYHRCGLVMALAFAAVVSSLVEDLLTPLIAAIVGEPDFSGLTFTINNSTFRYGEFINALISFILIGAAVYFFVVVPYTAYRERQRTGDAPTTKACPECLSEIPIGAHRCPYCTAQLPSVGVS